MAAIEAFWLLEADRPLWGPFVSAGVQNRPPRRTRQERSSWVRLQILAWGEGDAAAQVWASAPLSATVSSRSHGTAAAHATLNVLTATTVGAAEVTGGARVAVPAFDDIDETVLLGLPVDEDDLELLGI